jgi:hypothetical protein
VAPTVARVTWAPPATGAPATWFWVQWSSDADFSPRASGSASLNATPDAASYTYDVTGLNPALAYFVRVSAGNDAGFSSPAPAAAPADNVFLLTLRDNAAPAPPAAIADGEFRLSLVPASGGAAGDSSFYTATTPKLSYAASAADVAAALNGLAGPAAGAISVARFDGRLAVDGTNAATNEGVSFLVTMPPSAGVLAAVTTLTPPGPTTAPPAPHALVPPTTAPPYSGARGAADRYRYDGLPFPPGPLRKAAHHGAADRYDGLPFPPSPRLAAYVARLERRHRRAARQVLASL